MSINSGSKRPVRSFVLRAGRMTPAQERALQRLWPRHGVEVGQLADPGALFGRRRPLYLEIGIGNGDNLVAAATRERHADHLGCEVHRPGIGHALLGIESLELDNVRLVVSDAIDVLEALPLACLDGTSIYFPDPWPKKRHHKRRLFSARLLDLLARCTRPSGWLRFASDDADYAAQAAASVAASTAWLNLCGPGAWAPRPHARIVTRFEQRALHAGRTVFDLLAAPASVDQRAGQLGEGVDAVETGQA